MFQTGAALTPMSLADGSFTQTRPSPVASHHSQEYQFNVGVSVPTHGLGITAPSATDFPQAMYHELGYAAESMGYGITETPRSRLSPAKRSRRLTRRTAPARSGTVHIWPHPDGAQRFEQERQQNQTNNQVSTRLPSSGWGRRDPHREEELDFVDKLRDEGHSWKIISQLYSERFKKPCTSAQLQMRRTRRRERSARWDENDVSMCVDRSARGSAKWLTFSSRYRY